MTTYSRFGTYNQVLPANGPKVYPFNLDFRVKGTQDIDMQPEITGNFISYISGVIIDNRQNGNDLEIKVATTNQSVGIPAGKQAHMPLLVTDAAQLQFVTPVDNNLVVPIFVVNFPLHPYVW